MPARCPAQASDELVSSRRRGNWIEFKDGPATSQAVHSHTVNGVNQYLSWSLNGGGAIPPAPAHDAAGNMTVDPMAWNHWAGPNGLKYEYDEENRLAKVRIEVNDALVAEYKYDALGRRVETIQYWDLTGTGQGPVHTRHVYAGLETIQEYICCDSDCASGVTTCSSGWGLAREFLWGDTARFPEPVAIVDHTCSTAAPGCETGTAVYHFLRDVLGSVVGLTDASGNLVERYLYDPYGKPYIEKWDSANSIWLESTCSMGGPASALGNPFMWTGQRYDADVELYHFAFRSYSPFWGRWLQRDPIGYDGGSINLYEYVMGNPLYWIDPLGLYMLNDEEKKLKDKTGYWEQLGVRNARKAAEDSVSGPDYDRGILNGPGDAVRHCVWNCEMTRRNNKQSAKNWADAHEPKTCDEKNPQDEKDMDLHNNEVGRENADNSKGADETTGGTYYSKSCKAECEQALKDGKLKVLPESRWGNRTRPLG